METSEAEALILAGAGTVWGILTDAGNYQVWDSGITDVRGAVCDGGTIRVRTRDGGKRTFRLRVSQVRRLGTRRWSMLESGRLRPQDLG